MPRADAFCQAKRHAQLFDRCGACHLDAHRGDARTASLERLAVLFGRVSTLDLGQPFQKRARAPPTRGIARRLDKRCQLVYHRAQNAIGLEVVGRLLALAQLPELLSQAGELGEQVGKRCDGRGSRCWAEVEGLCPLWGKCKTRREVADERDDIVDAVCLEQRLQLDGIALLLEHLLERLVAQIGALLFGQKLRAGVDAHFEGVFLQDMATHGVNGGDPRRIDAQRLLDEPTAPELGTHAAEQLACRLVGEGDGEQVLDAGNDAPRLVGEPVGEPVGERERLARSRARLNEQRPARRLDG